LNSFVSWQVCPHFFFFAALLRDHLRIMPKYSETIMSHSGRCNLFATHGTPNAREHEQTRSHETTSSRVYSLGFAGIRGKLDNRGERLELALG
jgi:hypothetical protein